MRVARLLLTALLLPMGLAREAGARAQEADAQAPQPAAQETAHPAPEMLALMRALNGRWTIREKFEPNEVTPDGGSGEGEETWRAGPGGFTLVEEIHENGTPGELYGVAFLWWDQDRGLQALWCDQNNPRGCDLAGSVVQWDGRQLTFDMEAPRGDGKLLTHEVFTNITPDSFEQTVDIGESSDAMKRWLTVQATRIPSAAVPKPRGALADEADLLALMAKRRKASMEGDSKTIAESMADEYVQTDIYGNVRGKKVWLEGDFKPLAALMQAGKFRWEVFEEKDVHLALHGDTAIATGRLVLQGAGARLDQARHTWMVDAGAMFRSSLQFTRVYSRQHGEWVLAAVHDAVPLAAPVGVGDRAQE
jgi:ketosteroid isomerase-like protein